VNDVGFSASLLDLSLGFKLKLIDGYWFRPYIEGGGSGGHYQLNYRTKTDTLNAIGNDWKKTDVIMSSGYYVEGGLEVAFTNNFGIKFAGRFSDQTTKDLVTLGSAKIRFRAETYYLSVLMGF
jgi:opacity protein-like surface antigen